MDKIVNEGKLSELQVEGKKIGQRGWFNRSKAQRELNVGHTMTDNIKKALEEILSNIA